MERAGYTFQMKRHPETYLNLDGKQMGAGGIDSWCRTRIRWRRTGFRCEARSFRYTLAPVR